MVPYLRHHFSIIFSYFLSLKGGDLCRTQINALQCKAVTHPKRTNRGPFALREHGPPRFPHIEQ